MNNIKLTLGPCLFNWHVDYWKKFYFEMADTPIDEFYIGEVVCLRRDPFYKDALDEVVNFLEKKGKKVIISTIQLVLGQPELKRAEELINSYPNHLVELNDPSVLSLLKDRTVVVGPTFNNYNEDTLKFLETVGAERFCLPYELDKQSIEILAKNTKKEIEVMVFGKTPLAISARCYHARLHNKPKFDCEYVCNLDYNGKDIKTMNNEDFLTINGTQTMSYNYNNLIMELDELKSIGVNVFRISPHYMNMKEVIRIFKEVLNNTISSTEGFTKLLKLIPNNSKFSNGFYYGISGKELEKSRSMEEDKSVE